MARQLTNQQRQQARKMRREGKSVRETSVAIGCSLRTVKRLTQDPGGASRDSSPGRLESAISRSPSARRSAGGSRSATRCARSPFGSGGRPRLSRERWRPTAVAPNTVPSRRTMLPMLDLVDPRRPSSAQGRSSTPSRNGLSSGGRPKRSPGGCGSSIRRTPPCG